MPAKRRVRQPGVDDRYIISGTRDKDIQRVRVGIEEHRVIWVEGPRGIGKTSLMRQILVEKDEDTIWIEISGAKEIQFGNILIKLHEFVKTRSDGAEYMSIRSFSSSYQVRYLLSDLKWDVDIDLLMRVFADLIVRKSWYVVFDNVNKSSIDLRVKDFISKLCVLINVSESLGRIFIIGQGRQRWIDNAYYLDISGLDAHSIKRFFDFHNIILSRKDLAVIRQRTQGSPIFIALIIGQLKKYKNLLNMTTILEHLGDHPDINRYILEYYGRLPEIQRRAIRTISLYKEAMDEKLLYMLLPECKGGSTWVDLIASGFVQEIEHRYVMHSIVKDVISGIPMDKVEVGRFSKAAADMSGDSVGCNYRDLICLYISCSDFSKIFKVICSKRHDFIREGLSEFALSVLLEIMALSREEGSFELYETLGDLMVVSIFKKTREKSTGAYEKALKQFKALQDAPLQYTVSLRIYRKLVRAYSLRGNAKDALRSMNEGMQLLDQNIDRLEHAMFLVECSRYNCFVIGDKFEEAFNFCEQAVRLLDGRFDPESHEARAFALHFQGCSAYYGMNDLVSARSLLESAENEWEQIDNKFAQSYTRLSRAAIIIWHDLEDGLHLAGEALQFASETGNIFAEVSAYNTMIHSLTDKGYFERAEKYIELCIPKVKGSYTYVEARLYLNHGNLLADQCRWDEAIRSYNNARDIVGKPNDTAKHNKYFYLMLCLALSDIYFCQGSFSLCMQELEYIRDGYRLGVDYVSLSISVYLDVYLSLLHLSGRAYVLQDIYAQVLNAHNVLVNKPDYGFEFASTSRTLAYALMIKQDFENALPHIVNAVEILKHDNSPVELGKTYLVWAVIHIRQGLLMIAKEHINHARTCFERVSTKYRLAQCDYCESIVLLLEGDVDAAVDRLKLAQDEFIRLNAKYDLARCDSVLAVLYAYPYLSILPEHIV